jgi:diacylglycerol kinase family enzyme
VLLNANAKHVRPSLRRALEIRLSKHDVFWVETLEETGDAVRTVLDRQYPALFIGGGDGTFAHTVTVMDAESRRMASERGLEPAWPAIGILRLGTGNALGHLAGAGRPLGDVVGWAAYPAPPVARVPLIRDDARGLLFPFASLGYDAGALNDYAISTGSWTHPWTRLVERSLAGYAWSLATRTLPRELGSVPVELRVEPLGRAARVDPDTHDEDPLAPGAPVFEGPARSVVVGTSPYYGYGIRVLPHAQRRSDRMHLRISSASAVFLLSHLPQLWSGELRSPDLHDFLVEGVRVQAERPIPVQWAGEAGGLRTELEWRLSGRTIRLLGGRGRGVRAHEPAAGR